MYIFIFVFALLVLFNITSPNLLNLTHSNLALDTYINQAATLILLLFIQIHESSFLFAAFEGLSQVFSRSTKYMYTQVSVLVFLLHFYQEQKSFLSFLSFLAKANCNITQIYLILNYI